MEEAHEMISCPIFADEVTCSDQGCIAAVEVTIAMACCQRSSLVGSVQIWSAAIHRRFIAPQKAAMNRRTPKKPVKSGHYPVVCARADLELAMGTNSSARPGNVGLLCRKQ